MHNIIAHVVLALFVFSTVILMASIMQFSQGNYDLGLIYFSTAAFVGLLASTPLMLLEQPNT